MRRRQAGARGTAEGPATGSGTVSSFGGGIACGSDCSESYVNGTVIALQATPDPGFDFRRLQRRRLIDQPLHSKDGWREVGSGRVRRSPGPADYDRHAFDHEVPLPLQRPRFDLHLQARQAQGRACKSPKGLQGGLPPVSTTPDRLGRKTQARRSRSGTGHAGAADLPPVGQGCRRRLNTDPLSPNEN
jgi:hypothetical protein